MSYLDERRKFIQDGRPLPEKKKYKLNPISEKRAKKLAEQKAAGTDGEMDAFFEEMRKRMTGRCVFCNGATEKNNDETYRNSIAHLLPKRPVDKGGFPSVGTHEENWIELCFYGNSCHTNFDNGMITWEFIKDSKEWDIISDKLLTLIPFLTKEEKALKLYTKIEKLLYGR